MPAALFVSASMQLAAARPATCASSRVGAATSGRASMPIAPLSRPLAPLHAVAGAQPAAAAVEQQEAPAPLTKPAFTDFPAPAASLMIEDNRAFVESHRIRGNEVGPDQRTSIISIAHLLQEAAANHAVAMWGRSSEGFASDPSMQGLIFVMTRMQIQMEHYPRWGDVIEIHTWFQQDSKLSAQRDFTITDKATGKQLGRATSTWVVINMQTRRLSRFTEAIQRKCEAFQLQPPRHAISPAVTRQKIPELELPAEIVGPIQVARRSDMDMNGHVNNVTYLAWAMETVPRDIYHNCHLYQIEIDYKAECHSGELVESLAGRTGTLEALSSNGAGPDAMSFVHVLRRCQGEMCTELVRARTTWRVGDSPTESWDQPASGSE